MKQTIKVADKPTADEIKSTVESNAEKLDGIVQELESGGMLSDPNIGLAALKQSLDELKNYVGNGKRDVASAITAKGIPTATDANFAKIVENIESIVTLMQGTQDATAGAGQILNGYTAYVKGSKVSGTVPLQGAQTITPGTSAKYVEAGRYLSGLQIIAGDGNLAAGNIKKGVSIFGVTGSYEGGGKVLEGTVNITEQSTAPQTLMNISNVPFTPKYVILYVNKPTETDLTYGLIQEGSKTYQYTQFVIPYNKKVSFSIYQSGIFINSNPSSSDSHYVYFSYANNNVTVYVKKYGSGSYSCKINPTNWSYIILG